MAEEIALELARIERDALAAVQARMAKAQEGAAFRPCERICCAIDGSCCGCCLPGPVTNH